MRKQGSSIILILTVVFMASNVSQSFHDYCTLWRDVHPSKKFQYCCFLTVLFMLHQQVLATNVLVLLAHTNEMILMVFSVGALDIVLKVDEAVASLMRFHDRGPTIRSTTHPKDGYRLRLICGSYLVQVID